MINKECFINYHKLIIMCLKITIKNDIINECVINEWMNRDNELMILHVCTCMYICNYVCMHVCMYMYVCTYVCMYVCM